MKHLKSFNEALHDLAGKRPTDERLSNGVWEDLAKMLNTGYVTSYSFKPIEWRKSKTLTDLDDILGVLDHDDDHLKKILVLTTIESDKSYEFELVETETFRMKYDKNNHNQVGIRIPYKHFILSENSLYSFYDLRTKALKYVQITKKANKTILGLDNIEYPNTDIIQMLEKWCPSYNVLIKEMKFWNSSSMLQLKNGTVELSNTWGDIGTKAFYQVVKSGRVYAAINPRKPVILTTPPLLTISDYVKCFDFILQRENSNKSRRKK